MTFTNPHTKRQRSRLTSLAAAIATSAVLIGGAGQAGATTQPTPTLGAHTDVIGIQNYANWLGEGRVLGVTTASKTGASSAHSEIAGIQAYAERLREGRVKGATTVEAGAPWSTDVIGIQLFVERMKNGDVLGATTQISNASVPVDVAAIRNYADRLRQDAVIARGGLAAGLVARYMQK